MYTGTIIHVTCRSYLIFIFVDHMASWLRPKNMPSETCCWNMTKCRDEIIFQCWPCHAITLVILIIIYGVFCHNLQGQGQEITCTVSVGCNYMSLPLISAYGTTLGNLNDGPLTDICLGLYWCNIRGLILVILVLNVLTDNDFMMQTAVKDSSIQILYWIASLLNISWMIYCCTQWFICICIGCKTNQWMYWAVMIVWCVISFITIYQCF